MFSEQNQREIIPKSESNLRRGQKQHMKSKDNLS